jgi:hypothetical protein
LYIHIHRCLPNHLVGPVVVARHADTGHVPVDLHWLGVVVANTQLHLLGWGHDEDLINEGPHLHLQEVQVGHQEAQLGEFRTILVQRELADVDEQAKLPVLRCAKVIADIHSVT